MVSSLWNIYVLVQDIWAPLSKSQVLSVLYIYRQEFVFLRGTENISDENLAAFKGREPTNWSNR